MGLQQWEAVQRIPVTLTDGEGVYVQAIITADQDTDVDLFTYVMNSRGMRIVTRVDPPTLDKAKSTR